MTDKDKVRAFLAELGVEFEELVEGILCHAGADRVGGYPGFFVDFEFDQEGKFHQIGAWE